MSMLTLERDRKTSPARLGKIALGAVFAGVVLAFCANVWVQLGYYAIGPGDAVRHSRYPGIVAAVDNGVATVTTFDGQSVTVPVAELIEQ